MKIKDSDKVKNMKKWKENGFTDDDDGGGGFVVVVEH